MSVLLFLSIATLFLGPYLCKFVGSKSDRFAFFDSFIFVSIGGLVLFHILPELLETGGIAVLGLMLVGLFGPGMVEKVFHKVAKQTHSITLILGVFGLVLHALTDGGALAIEEDQTAYLLAIGVVLHRFPVGLTVWWLLRPHYGRALPLAVLTAMSVATVAGTWLGGELIAHDSGNWLIWFQALVMGSILHVVFHQPYKQEYGKETQRDKFAAGTGSLIGAACLLAVLLPHWLGYAPHDHDSEDVAISQTTISQITVSSELHADDLAGQAHGSETAETLLRFVSLSLHAAPALLVAYLLTWLINFVKPAFNMVGQLRSTSSVVGALKGTLIGLPLPICIPDASGMYKQLIKAGCGSALAVSFLVASPVLGFDALLISLPLLGVEWVGIRLVMAIILAVTLGLLIGLLFKKHDLNTDTSATPEQLKQSTSRLKHAFEHGFTHLIDHTAPWVLFGLIAAATFTPTIGWQFLQQAPWLQVVLAIMIALPFHFCATGITPVLAIMLIAGVSPGAVVAFSLVGPTLNLDLYRFIKDNQGKHIAVAVVMAIVTVALLLGLGIMYWVPELPKPWLTLAPHWQDDWWRYVSLVIVTVLFAISLLRRGARSFMLELVPHSFRRAKPHHH
ncbi:permease [Moritella yayanosii]|uniref:Permease n=1 Tax=Moritella yayanosii TaxID=69539 RepID=A0A330LRD4_9GAMM|nr:permease [Moritella yayanosii]SQD79534.1 membrane protein of unknown function, might be Permease [Moritella yayanosii]